MLAETVDAVIGIDTHRDSHEVEIADAAGKPITVMRIGNDSAGFARLLAAIAQVAPGPRVAVCIEGSRSYGIGLARALAAAGLLVIECEQPSRKQRRGKGKSDPIDAHLAVLAALRLDAAGCRRRAPTATGRRCASCWSPGRRSRWPAPRRPAGCAPCCWPATTADRRAARTALTSTALAALAGRELPADASREQAVRQAEIRRLALALGQARQQLKDNRAQLLAIVDDLAPGLTSRYGIGPVSAAQAIVSFSHPGRCRSEAAFAALGGTSPLPASSGQTVRHRLNRGGDRALNRAIHAIALSPDAQLPPHPRLRRPAHRRRKDHPGNPPLPQALHRPRALPPAHPVDESSRGPLTNIEASEGWGFESLRARHSSRRSRHFLIRVGSFL